MSTEKWIAGAVASYTDAFSTATLNSIANGNAILSDLQLDNTANLDMFADISIALASAAFASPNFVGVYLYPLNKDNTTYGDGRFGTSAAGTPAGEYWVGNITLVAATQAQVGTLVGIELPPSKFKLVLYNSAGVALAASGNSCQYRTYNRQVL